MPAVLSVVPYNGGTPWQAAREVSELVRPVDEALAPCRLSQRYRVLAIRYAPGRGPHHG